MFSSESPSEIEICNRSVVPLEHQKITRKVKG